MLNDFGAVEDDGPSFGPQSRNQAIDAETGRHVRRRRQSFGIGVKLPQTEIAFLAAIEAPKKTAIERGDGLGSRPKPMLHDGGLPLAARADERDDARRAAGKGFVQQSEFAAAAEEMQGLRSAMMNRGGSHDLLLAFEGGIVFH